MKMDCGGMVGREGEGMNLEGGDELWDWSRKEVINIRWKAMAFNYSGTILPFLNKPYFVMVPFFSSGFYVLILH